MTNERSGITEQVTSVVKVLRECLITGDIGPFFSALRESDLPQIPLACGNDLQTAHRECTQVLHAIGMHSVGAAYALENHYFVLGGARMYQELYPAEDLERFLNRVRESRLLLANTRAAVHTKVAFSEGARATPDGDGYRVNGLAGFVSLAAFADLLWLQIEFKAGSAVFIVGLRDRESIQWGDLSFAKILLESETRSLSFHETRIEAGERIRVPDADLGPQGRLAAALELWHDSLIAAQFLGAAAGALEELVAFTKEMKSWSGRPFNQLDNVLSEVGRIGIRYAAAAALVGQMKDAIVQKDELNRALFTAKAVNWYVTNAAEDIVSGCRRLVGTRVFRGGSRLERLSTEVMIGPLVPRGNPVLEIEYGRYILEHFGVHAITGLGIDGP